MIFWQNHVEAFVKNDQKALEELWDFEYGIQIIREKAFFADGNRYESKQEVLNALNKMLADRRSRGKITDGVVALESLYNEIANAVDTKCKYKGCGKPMLARSKFRVNDIGLLCNECYNKYSSEQSINN